jgi:hypothetical protein
MKRLLLVCEGPADERTATTLADRKLRVSGPAWLQELLEQSLDEQRAWVTEVGGTKTRWRSLDALCQSLGVRLPRGRFGDEKRTADSVAARKAVFLLRRLDDVDALVIVRDLDDQPERAAGLEQGRRLAASVTPGLPVVLGLANPKREAWVLAGFVPGTDDERARAAALRQELGFDPCRAPHRLDATKHGAAHEAKRVLHVLTEGDLARERRCYEETPLEHLETQGGDGRAGQPGAPPRDCGLRAYLAEIAERLTPLLGG